MKVRRTRRQLVRSARQRLALGTYLQYRRPVAAWVLAVLTALLILASWADHRGILFGPGDRLDFFNGRWFDVVRVVDATTIELSDAPRKAGTFLVQLWGVQAKVKEVGPVGDGRYTEGAIGYTRGLCVGKRVRLQLESHRLRGDGGRLLAYVQLPDGSYLNECLLAEGLATTDERRAIPSSADGPFWSFAAAGPARSGGVLAGSGGHHCCTGGGGSRHRGALRWVRRRE